MSFKRPLFWLLNRVNRFIDPEKLVKRSGQHLFLPLYHTVSDAYLPHIHPLYPVRDTKAFERELDYLLLHFQPLELSEVINSVKNKRPFANPVFHLTFDDGLRECEEVIAPLLIRKGVPATFFLNSRFIDNKDLFFRYKAALLMDKVKELTPAARLQLSALLKIKNANEYLLKKKLGQIDYSGKEILGEAANLAGIDFTGYLNENKPYLTIRQVNHLNSQGFTFGAHSADHPNYAKCSIQDQMDQTIESTGFISQQFQAGYKVFAFPFTDDGVSAGFFERMRKEVDLDLSFGTSGIRQDIHPWHLQRFPMEHFPAIPDRIIPQAYLYYLIKRLFRRHIKKHPIIRN